MFAIPFLYRPAGAEQFAAASGAMRSSCRFIECISNLRARCARLKLAFCFF
jgi:hypothetical protein